MSRRPPPFVAGQVDRGSYPYDLGRRCAHVQIDVRPEHLGIELALHQELVDEADAGKLPFPGEYDLWHGFIETVLSHLEGNP